MRRQGTDTNHHWQAAASPRRCRVTPALVTEFTTSELAEYFATMPNLLLTAGIPMCIMLLLLF